MKKTKKKGGKIYEISGIAYPSLYICVFYIYIYVSQPNIVYLYCIERRLRSYFVVKRRYLN